MQKINCKIIVPVDAKFHITLRKIAQAWDAINIHHVIIIKTRAVNMHSISIVAEEHPKAILHFKSATISIVERIKDARGQFYFMNKEKLAELANQRLLERRGKTERIVDLPDPGKYTQAWKQIVKIAKDNPKQVVINKYGHYAPADRVRQEFIDALQKRISKRSIDLPAYWRYADQDMGLMATALHDRDIIDQYNSGIRHSGRNLLIHPYFKRRYPHIDNPDEG